MNSSLIPNPTHIDQAVRELIHHWPAPGKPKYELINLAAKMVKQGHVVQLGPNCYRVGFDCYVAQPETVASRLCTCSSTNLVTPCIHRLAVQIYQNSSEPVLTWDLATQKGKVDIQVISNSLS